MKNINKLKLVASIGLIFTGVITQAQWATFNVSDALYDYFKSQRDYVQNTNLEAIQSGQQLQMAQASQNVANADYRARMATVYHDITVQDEQQRPTIAQCIEVSKNQVGVAAVAATNSSSGRTSGGGGRGKDVPPTPAHYPPADPNKIQENIRTNENAQAMVLNNMKTVGTCSIRYGSTLCPSNGAYPLADVSTIGLLTNMKPSSGSNVNNGLNEIQNYSMTPAAYAAGQQYINLATLANAPKFPAATDISKNPAYISMYNAFIIKLNAAQDVLTSMLNMRKAPTGANSNFTFANTDIGKDWATVFPNLTPPPNPSFYEYLNARTMSDVFGPNTLKDDSQGSQQDILVRIQSKIALNNLLTWQQYQQQEKTNILLSHILIQQTTPVNKDNLDREFQKFNQN